MTTTLLPSGIDKVELSTFRILETQINAVGLEDLSSLFRQFLNDGASHQVVTVNVDFLRYARTLPGFQQLINDADLAVTDGRPLVWVAHYLGLDTCDRVTGPDVIDACARLSAEEGYRIYLLGSTASTLETAQNAIESRFPGVRICGASAPPIADYPFPTAIQAEIDERITDARPDILLVALGCPKQELWIRDNLSRLGVSIGVGVGGSFDFISGSVARAPEVFQRYGLEWLFRMSRDPRRLGDRYLRNDLPFALKLIALEASHRLRLSRNQAFAVVREDMPW